jgi:hypothetical protein
MDFIYSPFMLTDRFGFSLQNGGTVYFTTDGGITWGICRSGISVGLYGLMVITITRDGVSVADGGIIDEYRVVGAAYRAALENTMAYTQPGHTSIKVKDSRGAFASVPYYTLTDPTKTVAEVMTEAQALATAIDGASDGQPIEVRVEFVAAATTVKETITVPTPVEESGLISFDTVVGGVVIPRRQGQMIPALAQATIAPGDRINMVAPAITAVTGLLLTPGTSTEYANAQQQKLNAVVSNRVSFRKHRKLEDLLSSQEA